MYNNSGVKSRHGKSGFAFTSLPELGTMGMVFELDERVRKRRVQRCWSFAFPSAYAGVAFGYRLRVKLALCRP